MQEQISSAMAGLSPAERKVAQLVIADPDAATLAVYQRELATLLAQQDGVLSAFWQTRQTLAVNRSAEIDEVWPRICTQVKRYPALRTVRIQLNPRINTDEPVRWRQCATS